jgi:TldD protein
MENIMLEALKHGEKFDASLVEVRGQKILKTLITVKDGRVEASREGFEEGLGVRVLTGGAWGYSSTINVEKDSIRVAVEEAYRLAKACSLKVKEPVKLAEIKTEKAKVKWKIKTPPSEIPVEEKIDLALKLGEEAKKLEPRIRSYTVECLDFSSLEYLYTNEGARIAQEKTYVWLRIYVTGFEAGIYASASEEAGGTGGFEILNGKIEELSRKAALRVKGQLEAVPAKAGRYPALLGPSVVGVFVHESLGHMAEADLALAGSILLESMGKQIAPQQVSIYDDGGLEGAFGSIIFDDEGVRCRKAILVEDGVVVGLMHSRETAGKLEAEPTGNARAENFRYTPLVRMRNTYLKPKDQTLDELLEPIKFGYYLKTLRGGQVNMDGTFQVGVQEAYEIVNGEIGKPVRNLSISGNTLETLKKVEAVGKEFELFPGRCGKGQIAFISDGGPPIRVSEVRVGGVV